jgi:CRP-like cAMP-binding protein
LDPELGRLLSAERHARARVELRARVLRRKPGPWLVDGTAAEADAYVRLLILDGVVARDVSLEDVISTELLGSGDVIRPGTAGDADRLLGDQTSWSVLAECRVAVIDERCAQTLSAYPEVTTVLLERLERRSQRLARAQALVALTRVDRRLLAMLWQLAERWGRVTGDGVLLPLDISHRLLGQLVGARRPTISTAAAELARQGLLRRRDDGAWLLLGEPTGAPHDDLEHLLSRRGIRTDERVSKPKPAGHAPRD